MVSGPEDVFVCTTAESAIYSITILAKPFRCNQTPINAIDILASHSNAFPRLQTRNLSLFIRTLYYCSASFLTPPGFHCPFSMTPSDSHWPSLSRLTSPFSAPSNLRALFRASIPSLSPLGDLFQLSLLQVGCESRRLAARRWFAAGARFYHGLWRRRQRAAGLVSHDARFASEGRGRCGHCSVRSAELRRDWLLGFQAGPPAMND